MTMVAFRTHRYKAPLALILIGVFFAGQALSCCVVNHRLGQYLQSLLTPISSQEHSCCPSHAQGPMGDQTGEHSGDKTCCIQDANQKHPQILSEQISLPQSAGIIESVLPAIPRITAKPFVFPEYRFASGPPAYLTHLQLLI